MIDRPFSRLNSRPPVLRSDIVVDYGASGSVADVGAFQRLRLADDRHSNSETLEEPAQQSKSRLMKCNKILETGLLWTTACQAVIDKYFRSSFSPEWVVFCYTNLFLSISYTLFPSPWCIDSYHLVYL